MGFSKRERESQVDRIVSDFAENCFVVCGWASIEAVRFLFSNG